MHVCFIEFFQYLMEKVEFVTVSILLFFCIYTCFLRICICNIFGNTHHASLGFGIELWVILLFVSHLYPFCKSLSTFVPLFSQICPVCAQFQLVRCKSLLNQTASNCNLSIMSHPLFCFFYFVYITVRF